MCFNRATAVIFAIICMCTATEAQNRYKIALDDVKGINPFHEGLTSFIDNGKRGVIDASGHVVIEAKFKRIEDFAGGMAIVHTETGKGIINRQGYFLLKPQYKEIDKCDEGPNLYIIKDSASNYGVFYNNRLVIPVTNKRCNAYNYPFIDIENDKDDYYYNLLTGESFDRVRKIANFYVAMKDGKLTYFDQHCNVIDPEAYSVSSKGVKVFADSSDANLFGLKDAQTGEIIAPAQFASYFGAAIWVNDRLYFDNAIVDAAGNTIISGEFFHIYDHFDGFIEVGDLDTNYLYSITGECVLKSEKYFHKLGDGWYSFEDSEGNMKVLDAIRKTIYDGSGYNEQEGMIGIQTQDDSYYYINAETGSPLKPKYKYGYDFSEGVAIVQCIDGKKAVIDKKGKILLKDTDDFEISNTYFSEGVIGAIRNGYINCYIYNPLGTSYVYNQEVFSDATIRQWWTLANEAFEKKNYNEAKEYYYRIMMDNPQNTAAINNYGACWDRLGHYDAAIAAYKMALKIDPSDKLVQDNLNKAKANKSQAMQPTENSGGFWQALASFGNMLVQISAALPGSDYGVSGTYSSGNAYDTASGAGMGASYYQSQYDRWANRAKSNYNSMTVTGYDTKNKYGRHSGSTMSGMNTGNYTLQKKALREAQQEMRRIRQEAARNGVSIRQSQWETATVGY